MTALALPQQPSLRWSWPRVGALSGTLSLHALAITLLLVPPAAIQMIRRAEIVVPIDMEIMKPPKEEKPPEVPLPKPQPLVHHETHPKPTPVQDVVVPTAPQSDMSYHVDPAPPSEARSIDPVESAPTPLAYETKTRIPYPRVAAQQHQQGTVILRVLVGIDGKPQTVEIEKSSGSRLLDIAARDAVARWTFQAGTRNGMATALWARVPINFSLQMQ